MAYKPRNQSPGFHHVVCRGNNKRDIYVDDTDREDFVRRVDDVARKYGWIVFAYALMRNHYHLVIEIGDQGLSDGMCELNTGYATEFNFRHGRINHLFGKRYWSDYLRTNERLLNAIRYAVQNPRRAGRAGPLEGHTWTSYAATIGFALSAMKYLATNAVLELFHTQPGVAKAAFIEFCDAPLPVSHDGRQPP